MAAKGFVDKHQLLSFLVFQIDNEWFAVDIKHVTEVLMKQSLVKLPNSPHYIEGLLQFRGKSLPVVNTYVKFSLPSPTAEQSFVYIMFEGTKDGKELGFAAMADKVNGVFSVKQGDIEEMPDTGSQSYTFINGLFRMNDQIVLIIDIFTVFVSDELLSISHLHENSSLTDE